eukprot:2476398-Alexandrium_andersonii.AAC.1
MQQLAESYNVGDYAEREFQWKRLLHIDQMLVAKPRKVGDETPTSQGLGAEAHMGLAAQVG